MARMALRTMYRSRQRWRAEEEAAPHLDDAPRAEIAGRDPV
jgi:hypothetical protein